MDIYAVNIMDHYKTPRHSGGLSDANGKRHEANSLCGDKVDIDVKIENGVLVDAAFRGEGCAISQAAISILLDEVIGLEVGEILGITKGDIHDMLGVPITARRTKCAVLGLLALQNAILDYQGDEVKSFADILL